MTDEPTFDLPATRTARDLDFSSHDYLCPACHHQQHDACDSGCRFCASPCTCECQRWRITRNRRR